MYSLVVSRNDGSEIEVDTVAMVLRRPVSSACGLNMGQVYLDSGKIRIGCIQLRAEHGSGVFAVLRVSDQPNGFRAHFLRLFRFLSKSKTRHIYYLKLFVFNANAFKLQFSKRI